MRNLINTFLIALFFFILVPVASSVHGASLQFDPTTKTTTKDQTFQINIDIDAGTNEILATDAKISYDKSLLQVTKVDNGTYFKTIGKADFTTTQGQIYIAGIVDDPGDFKKGTGTIATVTFKAIADGTATLAYICTPGETGNDSNIANNDFDATDVINCAENGTSRITIGTGVSTITPTVTPVTTIYPTSTPAPTISSLPQTGMFDQATGMNILVPMSVLMVLAGIVVKMLLR